MQNFLTILKEPSSLAAMAAGVIGLKDSAVLKDMPILQGDIGTTLLVLLVVFAIFRREGSK
tara:strand:+ start:102 stop:284 length:183 start_codon:yes stop_codon:yes gene_type:complete